MLGFVPPVPTANMYNAPKKMVNCRTEAFSQSSALAVEHSGGFIPGMDTDKVNTNIPCDYKNIKPVVSVL